MNTIQIRQGNTVVITGKAVEDDGTAIDLSTAETLELAVLRKFGDTASDALWHTGSGSGDDEGNFSVTIDAPDTRAIPRGLFFFAVVAAWGDGTRRQLPEAGPLVQVEILPESLAPAT